MSMRRKGGYGILAGGVAALVLHAGAALGAPTPEQKCEGSKNDTAGKYAACIGKAEKSLLATGDAARYATAISKCESKQATSWSKAEASAMNAGTTCPSQGDGQAIQDFVGACAAAVADAVAGNPLIQDPVSCDADLQTCTSHLGDCTSDFSACQSDLGTCEGDLASCIDSLGQPLKKTGQTTCYHNTSGAVISCAGTGQDAAFQAGATHNYTDNGDGTITDNNTNLMWEKLSDNGSIHDKDTAYAGITAAYGKITSLNTMAFAGYTDWRLPNLRELGSLLDYGRDNPAVHPVFHTGCVAGCNGVTCSCTRSDVYTTSTTYRMFSEANWSYNFTDGDMYANYKTDSRKVRAVRTAN